MGFWTKSVLIFKSLCENANQSIRQLACQTGMSKSSVHRLTQAIARRDRSPESWLWETEDGSTVAHASAGGNPLYLRSQARRRSRNDQRVFHASASRDADGMFAFGLAQGDGRAGGSDT